MTFIANNQLPLLLLLFLAGCIGIGFYLANQPGTQAHHRLADY